MSLCSELTSAGTSAPLANILAKNVDKAISLFNMRCDDLVLRGRDALQVSSGPNHTQLRNINIVNCLHSFYSITTQHVLTLSSIHKSAKNTVSQSLSKTLTLLRGVVSPFVHEVQRMMVEMVESMHGEDYAGCVYVCAHVCVGVVCVRA